MSISWPADCGLVIRFQGSDNAGHTVVNEHGRFGLHLVPSGIFHGKVRNLLGPGTGVNPDSFLNEIKSLDEKVPQLQVRERIMIAERAHVIMPYHRTLDGAQERSRGDLLQGTTGRGNGPLYADKHARSGNPDRRSVRDRVPTALAGKHDSRKIGPAGADG